jgi:NAD(P)-dependent dehydrogenase (short-subunit alcohol dehydrogenase family)
VPAAFGSGLEQHSRGDEFPQAVRQDVLGNSEAALEFAEAPFTCKGVAKDQQAPPVAIQADVAKPTEVARLFARSREALGPVDVLVNNAGSP